MKYNAVHISVLLFFCLSATAPNKVGIGTTSPDEKLHISNGKMYLQDNRSN